MIATSPGSQPDPQRFLTAYAEKVESAIRDLQNLRVAQKGDYALKGQESQDIKTMAQNKVIQV